jgi:hypothetical protein
MGLGRKEENMNEEITTRNHLDEVPVIVRGPANRDVTVVDQNLSNAEASRAGINETEPLLPPDDRKQFRSRWETLQVGFVDDPGNAVDRARELVSEAVRGVTQTLNDAEHKLQQELHSRADVSTEEQRLAFQRYRSFLQHLLAL